LRCHGESFDHSHGSAKHAEAEHDQNATTKTSGTAARDAFVVYCDGLAEQAAVLAVLHQRMRRDPMATPKRLQGDGRPAGPRRQAGFALE
jgi:hypothetical protein